MVKPNPSAVPNVMAEARGRNFFLAASHWALGKKGKGGWCCTAAGHPEGIFHFHVWRFSGFSSTASLTLGLVIAHPLVEGHHYRYGDKAVDQVLEPRNQYAMPPETPGNT